MKNSEIRQLSTKELIERIEEEKIRLVKMKMNHAISPLENPLEIRNTRRTIARLKTELRRRQLEESKK
jgi:large subunit ribosomal protein L29